MSEYFPEPKFSGGKVKFELSLSNYATKVDLKDARGVGTSNFAKKVGLANLKSNVDKLDVDKLKNVPSGLSSLKRTGDKLDVGKLETTLIDLSELSNVVKNDVVKKTEYNATIKNIEDKIPDITNLSTKTTLNGKINEVKGEMHSINNLATTADLNANINEVKNKIPNIADLATTTALTVIENTDYNGKSNEIEKKFTDHDHDKYNNTPKFNTRLVQAILATKTDIANFVKKIGFDEKLKNVTSNKNELIEI